MAKELGGIEISITPHNFVFSNCAEIEVENNVAMCC
jgi:hypothetical protein